MQSVLRAVVFIGTVLCAVQAVFADASTQVKLDSCVLFYQDGDYQRAVDSLKALLPLISDRHEEAEAYKYLGFSYVMLEKIDKAREFFRVALDKFPQMVIDTLEVPPNISVVFKQTKLESQMEKGEILDKSVQERSQKRAVVATVLTATGAASAGVSGYFFYRANQSHSDYTGITETFPTYQDDLDRYWGQMRRQLIIGGCCAGVAAVNLSLGIYLFLKKPVKPKKTGLLMDGDRICLEWRF